jgi:hypothetical protein
LRNTMNLDVDGKPYAVEILREREEDEGEDDRP